MSLFYLELFLIFLSTLILTVITVSRLIPFLKERARQPIYEDGPNWHLSKSGTPTMGGIGFVGAIILTLSVFLIPLFTDGKAATALSIMCVIIFGALNSLIGLFDDILKLKRKKNGGLTPLQKLGLQLISAVIFLYLRFSFLGNSTEIQLGTYGLELGAAYYPLAVLLLLGATNCANLTDGVDGLASSVAFSIGIVLMLISINQSHEVSYISSALIGGMVGFLIFNVNPARIFMGDTGSLFLGATAVGCGFSFNNPFLILLPLLVYVIEGASVIIQVACFKLFGKRVLKMAPLHHHLEKCGWNESKICIWAMIITLLTVIPSILLLRV